jgi:hypothetical protein
MGRFITATWTAADNIGFMAAGAMTPGAANAPPGIGTADMVRRGI